MEKYKYESKSKENLLSLACDDLKVTEDDILYNITEEKKGLFGKKYYIEIIKINDVAEYGKSLILDFLKGFNLKGNVEIKVRDKSITYKIFTDNNAILIGKRGHILESLQNFVRQALLNSTDIFVNVIIDVENYKEKQIYFLEKKVRKIAKEVTASKGEVKLDPMDAYTRKLVHDALQDFKNISTDSEGEEPNRYIVIKYKESKEE